MAIPGAIVHALATYGVLGACQQGSHHVAEPGRATALCLICHGLLGEVQRHGAMSVLSWAQPLLAN